MCDVSAYHGIELSCIEVKMKLIQRQTYCQQTIILTITTLPTCKSMEEKLTLFLVLYQVGAHWTEFSRLEANDTTVQQQQDTTKNNIQLKSFQAGYFYSRVDSSKKFDILSAS